MIAIATTDKAQHGTRENDEEFLKSREYRVISPGVHCHLFHCLAGPTPKGTPVQYNMGSFAKSILSYYSQDHGSAGTY